MIRRMPVWALSLALALALAAPSAAPAYNNGRGFYGATNDKVVTNSGFIVIIFFALFVFVMSMLQRHLDRRKQARHEAREAQLSDARWRGGW